MNDLREAILARCDELERITRAADSTLGGHWYAAGDDVLAPLADDEPFGIADAGDDSRAEHIATWDPAAVLALVDGARDLVNAVQRQVEDDDPYVSLPDEALAALAKMLGVPVARAGVQQQRTDT